MSRKPKPNVTPDDVGKFYTDGKDVYRLEECATEPIASMIVVGTAEPSLVKPISGFAGFVRLIQEHPINKVRGPDKAPRKRKGKGDIAPDKAEDKKKSKIDHFITCPSCRDAVSCVKEDNEIQVCRIAKK